MENPNHANSKKSDQRKINVHLGDGISTQLIHKDLLEEINLDSSEFDIFIKKNSELFEFSTQINSSKKINCRQENFDYIFKKLIFNFKQNTELTEYQNKNYTSFHKNKNWSEKHKIFLKLNDFLLDSKNIINFSQKLLTLDNIQKFLTIHLFIHEKGAAYAKHFEISKFNSTESLTAIKDFSTLFQAIKKSKNKSFGQSSLKASNFQIIGTCIAFEYALENHNMILIFSKDDFLPQEQEDIDFFNEYKDGIKSYFELILNMQFNYEKCQTIIDSLKNLSHELNNELNLIEAINENKTYQNLLSTDYNSLLQSFRKEHVDLADINHQERISLLGELLNTLKHELSNPLFGLQLSSELLQNEDFDEDQTEFIQQIHANILRSQSIITNFSGLYNEKPQLVDIELKSFINEVYTLTKSETKQIRKNIQFSESDDFVFKTNPTWLAQIFFNLIINSAQALKDAQTQSPQITIDIQKHNQTLSFCFSDNGPGIACKNSNELFEAFYTTKEAGTGLGLAISKRLVEKMNGTITYVPTEVGTKFEIKFNL